MLPGKKYTPEDLLTILRRRIWWILVPFALIAAGTAAVARKLPDRYYSDALVRVVPQQVPDQYVRPLQTEGVGDRLVAMSAQVLSRTRLEHLITQFNLYPEERRNGIMQDVVDQMRGDIAISPPKGDVFRVGFSGSNPRTVQQVASQLADFFVTESATDQQSTADQTNQFLEAQVEEARRQLIEQERKLQDYKLKFSGQLPTQLEANLQAQANAQMQIRQITDSLSQETTRRMLLDSQARELEAGAPPGGAPLGTPALSAGGESVQGGTSVQQLEFAKAQLALLQKHYTDAQPDVKRLKGIVADLQAKVDAEALQRPVSADPVPVSSVEVARQRRLKETKEQITAIDQQMASEQADVKRLRAINDDLQRRIDAVPARESDMADLMRDYQTMTQNYNSLLSKREDSKLAANLQNRQFGEQFKIIDFARIPEKPNSPNRPMINLGGMAAGFGVGLALVALLEYRDRSFKTDDEVISLLALPVLAVVPLMQSNDERRRARRRRLYLGLGLGSTVVGCLAVLIYTFVR